MDQSVVVIGMDPHKRSATIEVMAGDEQILGRGRFDTDAAGYKAMMRYAKQWPARTWAVEGCQGIGGHERAMTAKPTAASHMCSAEAHVRFLFVFVITFVRVFLIVLIVVIMLILIVVIVTTLLRGCLTWWSQRALTLAVVFARYMT